MSTTKKGRQSDKVNEDTAAMVIVIAKRLQLSFDELNEMSVQDLIDIAHVYTGAEEGSKPEKRRATQTDIDRFTGWRPKK